MGFRKLSRPKNNLKGGIRERLLVWIKLFVWTRHGLRYEHMFQRIYWERRWRGLHHMLVFESWARTKSKGTAITPWMIWMEQRGE